VIVGVLRLVPRFVGRGSEGNDYVGTVLLSAGLALLTFGVIEDSPYGWFEAARLRTRAVDELGLHRPTLDDVFLTLTGHAAEPDGAGASGGSTRRR
jgi:hypothetical protein